jgi:hypothetical protein
MDMEMEMDMDMDLDMDLEMEMAMEMDTGMEMDMDMAMAMEMDTEMKMDMEVDFKKGGRPMTHKIDVDSNDIIDVKRLGISPHIVVKIGDMEIDINESKLTELYIAIEHAIFDVCEWSSTLRDENSELENRIDELEEDNEALREQLDNREAYEYVW